MKRDAALDSNAFTRTYFDSLLVEMRQLDAVRPDLTLSLYGETFSTPLMMAALSHLKGKGGEGDGMTQMAEGAKLAGAVNWAGMGSLEQFDAIAKTGARTIKIIKPYADESMVLERIDQAEALGALAVGMDIDHSFGRSGDYDVVLGLPMRPRSAKEIEAYCKRTSLPFVIKGVLSATDARKCLDAGVRGIVVSHHHGVLRSCVPPLMVLPEIVRVIAGRIPIFVDCGIMNGLDAYKCLALGATAVSIGRPVMDPILEEGPEGVVETLAAYNAELRETMGRTNAHNLSQIDPSVLWTTAGHKLF